MSEESAFTPDEALRYSRHFALPELGRQGQDKLKRSSVLVVGAGGLGTPAAVYLASAGVGRIGVADFDSVRLQNLQRQFLYSDGDVGRRKVDVAVERLEKVNPRIEISGHFLRLDPSNALEVLRNYDVVVDATDDVPSRYLISDASVMLGKPDVYAGAIGTEGQATVFFAKRGPCYRCLCPDPPLQESVRSCEESGVLGAVTGVLGALQASQVIQLIVGIGSPLIGRLVFYDGLRSTFEDVTFGKSESCPACGPNPSLKSLKDYERFRSPTAIQASAGIEISAAMLKSAMEKGEVALVDVREPSEFEICHLEGAKLVPLGDLAKRMTELDGSRLIVAYCHHGVRSLTAAAMLRQAGFSSAKSLRGGIEAWALQVDSAVPRY